MAQYDKENGINTTHTDKHLDKPKGEMSIREAAAMEMPQQQHMETGMRGTPVHGFGNGTETMKRHTGTGMNVDMGTPQRSAGESVTEIIDQVFQLPFHAQLSVMRMIAARVLGAMDARDRENFLTSLRTEHGGEDTSGESTEAQTMNTPDIQGT
ncbi:hypothetical protein [Archangium sp.]|uniref:hypothetical protein n=1 Tax=Archangium sp. TaxID=1872627 RepID=UPI002D53BAEA|nr:hypothetical protein [Archangium sp.]HYO54935.1 hypothetical protein [Archangium sp.]